MGEEMIQIRNKIILCVFVAIIIISIGLLIVFRRFGNNHTNLYKAIDEKESCVVLFNDKKSKTSLMVKNILKQYNIDYLDYNVNNSEYETVLKKLGVDYEIPSVSIVVIEKGKMVLNIIDVSKKEEVINFINNHKLVNNK